MLQAEFFLYPYNILDDHTPFLQAGIPAADIIDFWYGSSKRKNDYWHTPNDTMDKISEKSLEKVGNIVLYTIYKLK